MSLVFDRPSAKASLAYAVGQHLIKASASPTPVYGLAGRLYVSQSGWGLLSVPNAFLRGAFDALHEPGAELPTNSRGNVNAHISVFNKADLEQIGGADKLTERGHTFRYTLGPVKSVTPPDDELGKVWLIEVRSPELEKLRKSYGLSALPHDNKYKFHITIGVRKKNVLFDNSVSKAT